MIYSFDLNKEVRDAYGNYAAGSYMVGIATDRPDELKVLQRLLEHFNKIEHDSTYLQNLDNAANIGGYNPDVTAIPTLAEKSFLSMRSMYDALYQKLEMNQADVAMFVDRIDDFMELFSVLKESFIMVDISPPDVPEKSRKGRMVKIADFLKGDVDLGDITAWREENAGKQKDTD